MSNGGRPLPWHDTARCEAPDAQYAGVAAERGACGGPMVPARAMPNGYGGPRNSRIACAACGHGRIGTPEDVAKTERAHRAWELYEAGTIHTDRCCARCGGVLMLDRVRLCASCVDADNAERQASLFPGAP